MCQKIKVIKVTQLPTLATYLQDTLVQQCHKCYGDKHFLCGFKIYEMEPIPDTIKVAKKLRLEKPRGKTSIWLKEHSHLRTKCYTRRSASHLGHIWDISSCIGINRVLQLENVQRLIYFRKFRPKWDAFIKALPLSFRNWCGKGRRKIVQTRKLGVSGRTVDEI